MSESSNDGSVKTPVYKKWWFWAIIAVVVIGAIAGGVLGGGAGETDDTDDAPTQYAKGETATLDDFEYTVQGSEEKSILATPGASIFSDVTMEAGSEWVCVTIKIKNTKSYSQSIGSSDFELVVDGGGKYEVATDTYTKYYNEPNKVTMAFLNTTISIDSGFSPNVVMLFKVPTETNLDGAYVKVTWAFEEIHLLLA